MPHLITPRSAEKRTLSAVPDAAQIVEESSATLEDYPQRAIPANHVGMVQFGSPGDPGFRALTSELDSWVSALSSRVGPVGLSPGERRAKLCQRHPVF